MISAQPQSALPQLVQKDGSTQLYVDRKPFLVLGGELGNSTASSMDYIRPYWSKFREMQLNTVLSPVYWELLEPEENRFDFSLVDSLLINARRHQLRLVLLWFGTWKNSMSCYAPPWVKKNQVRFPRTQDKNGRSMEILSVFSPSTLAADQHAFTALMKHLRQADPQHTVLMIQVENEIGMLSTARERSRVADSAFNATVPAGLINWMQTRKNTLAPSTLR